VTGLPYPPSPSNLTAFLSFVYFRCVSGEHLGPQIICFKFFFLLNHESLQGIPLVFVPYFSTAGFLKISVLFLSEVFFPVDTFLVQAT